jgi:hypothetical protein
MRYFYDSEFIEDGKTIDLISIGIIAEDGREYYAISTQFNAKKADPWVVENVIKKLPIRYPGQYDSPNIKEQSLAWKSRDRIRQDIINFCDIQQYGKPEFWAYYADYDHVVLCQLFGKMIDLPKGWPMYTRDIKQLCDSLSNPRLPEQDPSSEHNALADAKWAKEAYEFLLSKNGKN